MDRNLPLNRWEWRKNLAAYVASVLVPLLVLIGFFQLWKWSLDEPIFAYKEDGLYTAMQVQAVFETGSYLSHPRCGAPWTGDLYDFPLGEGLHFFVLKMIHQVVGGNAFTAINLYYLLSFPLTALTGYFVLRRLALPRLAALVAALLFAFLPYHLHRSTGHFFLSLYYLVPLMILVVHWVIMAAPPAANETEPPDYRRWLKVISSLVVCCLMSWAGIYYAFFGCFYLVVGGLLGCIWQKSVRPALLAGLLIATITGAGILGLAPHIAYGREHGENDEVRRGSYVEAETFGLKIIQLVLPNKNHPLAPLRKVREHYDAHQAKKNEQAYVALGICGTLGFGALLAGLFFKRKRDPEPGSWMDAMGILNGAGVLLATVGGLGVVVALALPSIRAYNRMAVYLGFFSLAGFAYLLTAVLESFKGRLFLYGLRPVIVAFILAFGLWESLAGRRPFTPEPALAKFYSDRDYARQAEAALAPGAKVFQLPYYPFPETYKPPGQMKAYEHLEMPLVSTRLHWSFGTMRGRAGDRWQAAAAALPLEEQVRKLALAGFDAIHLNRKGYDDRGQELERQLRDLLRQAPYVSRDGNLCLFPLHGYVQELRSTLPEDEWQRAQQEALKAPLRIQWSRDFSGEEQDGLHPFRWCTASEGKILIQNEYGVPRQVKLTLEVLSPRPATIQLASRQFTEEMQFLPGSRSQTRELRAEVPVGAFELRISTDARATRSSPDERAIYFQVRDVTVIELP